MGYHRPVRVVQHRQEGRARGASLSARAVRERAPRGTHDPLRAPPRRPRDRGVRTVLDGRLARQLAATLFLQGCPWNCAYCHNPGLITRGGGEPRWRGVRDTWRRVGPLGRGGLLRRRAHRQAAVVAAIDEVRQMGFLAGVHTAGAYPAGSRRSCRRWNGWASTSRRGRRYGAVTGVDAGGVARGRPSTSWWRRDRLRGARDGRPHGPHALSHILVPRATSWTGAGACPRPLSRRCGPRARRPPMRRGSGRPAPVATSYISTPPSSSGAEFFFFFFFFF